MALILNGGDLFTVTAGQQMDADPLCLLHQFGAVKDTIKRPTPPCVNWGIFTGLVQFCV